MSATPAPRQAGAGPSLPVRAVEAVGRTTAGLLDRSRAFVHYLGGMTYLAGDTLSWAVRGFVTPSARIRPAALAAQMVRVGVRSIPVIVLVQTFIGIILALQMAPTLAEYGQLESVADIVAIAMFRELGPLISAIVLSGYAGASIAAEIGSMVEAEEIKALRAHALNPIRFLVVPRVIATVVMLTGLTVIADIAGVVGGFLTGWKVLGISPVVYIEYTRAALTHTDFLTGLVKAAVFGLLIAVIACYEGLRVTGGAVGVGRATTGTVVKSIVALITTDCLFTVVFYLFKL